MRSPLTNSATTTIIVAPVANIILGSRLTHLSLPSAARMAAENLTSSPHQTVLGYTVVQSAL